MLVRRFSNQIFFNWSRWHWTWAAKKGAGLATAASCGQMTLRAGHELVLILLGTLGLPSTRRQLLSAALFVLTLKDKFTYSS